MSFSRKRQQFLVKQGYSYKVVTKLAGMADELDPELMYKTKEEQATLLQLALDASDRDPGEDGQGDGTFPGALAGMSGGRADDRDMELEYNMRRVASWAKPKQQHPLFKKLRPK